MAAQSGAAGYRVVDGERRERVLRAAVRAGLLGPDEPAAGFLDVDGLREAVADLHRAFDIPGVPVLHTFAVKAASLVPVLRLLAREGMGCEAASAGELTLALAAGVPPARIVLDSPAKTPAELAEALRLGVAVNADNLQEVDRIARLRAAGQSASVLGLRINPQVGAGAIDAVSTASEQSKFGVPLRDPGARARLLDVFAGHPWLTRLHVHVGSQGCPPDLVAAGVRAVVELADEVNARAGRRQVAGIDLGGGLEVNVADDTVRPSHRDYADHLRRAVPGLFDGRYALVTEFGRSLVAKAGFTAALVEYTKDAGGRRIVLSHAGAHLATRTVLLPDAWPLRVSVHAPDGSRRRGGERPQDVAGPCCFAGDLVARDRLLPAALPGDIVVLHDTGGYYLSTPWAYNSLPRPAVHGFTTSGGEVRFAPVRRRQTLDEVVAESGGEYAGSLTALPMPEADGEADGGGHRSAADPVP